MTLFTNTTYPALVVQTPDRTFKFSGGKLEVDAKDAPLIQAFADRYPRYRIQEATKPRPQRKPAEKADDTAEKLTEKQALQAALRDIEESDEGTVEQLKERLSAAVGDYI